MKTIEESIFKKDPSGVLDSVIKLGKPVMVTTKEGNAVLISESEYRSMVETIALMSNPEFVKGLKKAEEQDRATYAKFDPKKDLR